MRHRHSEKQNRRRPTPAGRRRTVGWKAERGEKLKQMEDENRKLKHVVAELTLDNRALKDVLSKNW